MATVESECTCQKCKYEEAISVFCNRSNTKYTACQRCGYRSTYSYITGQTKEDGDKNGTYSYKSCSVEVGGILPRSRAVRERVIHQLRRSARKSTLKRLSITQKVRGRWKTKVLKDQPKPTYLRKSTIIHYECDDIWCIPF